MINVGKDINNLLSEVQDYISDAITTLDSARDKIAFLDLDWQDPQVEKLSIDTKNLLKNLQAQKRRMIYLHTQVKP